MQVKKIGFTLRIQLASKLTFLMFHKRIPSSAVTDLTPGRYTVLDRADPALLRSAHRRRCGCDRDGRADPLGGHEPQRTAGRGSTFASNAR